MTNCDSWFAASLPCEESLDNKRRGSIFTRFCGKAEDGAVDLFDDHYFHDDDDDCDDDGQSVVMGSPASAAEPWPGGLQQPCLCADAGRG